MQFKIFNFPVQVQGMFWITGLLMWALIGHDNPTLANIGGGVCILGALFLCILVHELGHAFFARWYGGRDVNIVLHGFGGQASWNPSRPNTWRERFIISVSGPGLGFLPGILASIIPLIPGLQLPPLGKFLFDYMWYISIIWGVINLIPLRPMDGFEALRSLFGIYRGHVPKRLLESISIFFGCLLVAAALYMGMIFAAAIFGHFTWQSIQKLNHA